MKWCPKCNSEKDESEFHKNSSEKSGLCCYCEECNKKLGRKNYKNLDPNRKKNYILMACKNLYIKRREDGIPMRKPIEDVGKVGVCKIIHDHHEKMKEDPERLTTEFIQVLLGRKCD